MKPRFSITVCAIVVGASSLTLCHPPTPRIARVEVPPYAITTITGTTVKDVRAVFIRAEQAIQEKSLDGLPNGLHPETVQLSQTS